MYSSQLKENFSFILVFKFTCQIPLHQLSLAVVRPISNANSYVWCTLAESQSFFFQMDSFPYAAVPVLHETVIANLKNSVCFAYKMNKKKTIYEHRRYAENIYCRTDWLLLNFIAVSLQFCTSFHCFLAVPRIFLLSRVLQTISFLY